MGERLNASALGYAAAIISGATMLLLGVLGNLGIYTAGVQMMQQWHVFFSLSIVGIIAGTFEAAVAGFVYGYAFGRVYNKFV
jgi:hypothetical protein